MKRTPLPKYVSPYRDRHGKLRYRYRRNGISRQLPGPPNSPEFRAALEEARQGIGGKPAEPRFVPGSFDELIASYYKSNKFEAVSETRQRIARGILESFREEYGRDLVANCKPRHIEAILKEKKRKKVVGKRMVGGPEAARALHKQLKRLTKHHQQIQH